MGRAGASTIFISTSTSTSICNMCQYEYKYEYFITWFRVRVLVDHDEYEYEYRPMIYILYMQQYCIFQSLKRESSDFYKPATKLQLPIVYVNSLCQYIYLSNYSMQFSTTTLQFTCCEVLAVMADNYN